MIYNCHTHIFTDQDVPDGFLPLGLVPLMRGNAGARTMGAILHNINPFSSNDSLDKMKTFIDAGRLGSQRAVFYNMAKYYPTDTRFVILPMDMAYMGAGRPNRPYINQLYELDRLAQEDSRIIPFFMADPRRGNLLGLFEEFVIKRGWQGVKIYNSLGYFPYDTRLDPIYKYCEDHGLPIMAHCTYGNPVHWKGCEFELADMLGEKYDKKASRKDNCNKFTDPMNWAVVAQRYPRLKICLAHAGGSEQWLAWYKNPKDSNNLLNVIRRLCVEYANIYTDISFTLAEPKAVPLLKMFMLDSELSRKILAGSDHYMNLTESTEAEWSIKLRAELGEDIYRIIAENNPKRYLYEYKQ